MLKYTAASAFCGLEEDLPSQTHLHRQGHQLLLGPVVDVSFEAPGKRLHARREAARWFIVPPPAYERGADR